MTIQPVPLIGVVGGVGCGKSTLSRAAAARWPFLAVLDGDAAGHAVLRLPPVHVALRDRFGPGVLDGGGGYVDRSALADRVFGGEPERKAALADLQRIVHPHIRRLLLSKLADAAASGAEVGLLDAAVLLESGWREDCWKVIFVDVPREERLRRVLGRGWDAAELDRREASQWPLEKKRAACDAVIHNARPPEEAVDAFGGLLARWSADAAEAFGGSAVEDYLAAFPAALSSTDTLGVAL